MVIFYSFLYVYQRVTTISSWEPKQQFQHLQFHWRRSQEDQVYHFDNRKNLQLEYPMVN